MAENFGDAREILGDQLREYEDEHRLAWHLVRSLRFHRSFTFDFNQKSHTLELEDGVWQYGVEQGLPGDILRIVEATLVDSSDQNRWPLHQISVPKMRRLHFGTSATGSPDKYAWFERALWLYPVPADSDESVLLDCYTDASRDEHTGAEIDEDSVNESNVFLREAEGMILARAAYTYALSVLGDSKEAQEWKVLHDEEYQSLMRERDARVHTQAPWYL